MTGVSCRAIDLYLDGLRMAGLPEEKLVEGTAFELEYLRNPRNTLAWNDYAALANHFETLVEDWVIDALGKRYAVSGPFRAIMTVSSRLLGPGWVIEQQLRVHGAMLFPVVEAVLERRGSREVFVRMVLPEGSLACPVHFRITRSVLRDVPSIIGVGEVESIIMTLEDRGASYTIRFEQPIAEAPPKALDDAASTAGDEIAVEAAALREQLRSVEEQRRVLDRERHALRHQVDELERTRAALEQSEARWRSLAAHAPDSIVSVGPDGRIVGINRSRLVPVEQVLGRRPSELCAIPGEALMVEEALSRVLAGEQVVYQITGVPGPDAPSVWSCHAGPVVENDQVVGATIIARDVTEQVRHDAERRSFERHLEQAARVEGLALLAGGIAHDFNNLLLGITANVDLALATLPSGAPARRYLDRAKGITSRAAVLTGRLLSTAGTGPQHRDTVSVFALVEEIREHLAATLPAGVTFMVSVPHDLPALHADPAQLHQVLLNLVANARDALGPGPGTIEVSAQAEGPGVTISVRDDGPGMSPEVRDRIFEPFFTTKPRGTGLGLAAALGIIRAHGGTLTVDSSIGRGATFTIRLSNEEPESVHVAQGRILIADDDASVREALVELLRSQGFATAEAADGTAALARWRAEPTLTAVVLDLQMPGISGDRVLELARRQGLLTPCIVTSARQTLGLDRRLVNAGHAMFLAKPFDGASLRQAVDDLLRAAPPADLNPASPEPSA